MLVLTRKQNEQIQLGNDITITVIRTKGKAVRLGIEAPKDVNVLRGELVAQLQEQQSEEAATAITMPAKRPERRQINRLPLGQRSRLASQDVRSHDTEVWPTTTVQAGAVRASQATPSKLAGSDGEVREFVDARVGI